jgi:hypothetical protein
MPHLEYVVAAAAVGVAPSALRTHFAAWSTALEGVAGLARLPQYIIAAGPLM